MSDNLALGTLPEGVESPEALINGAFSAIDSLLTESYDIDLSAGNAAPTAVNIRRASFISLLGAAQAREVTLPVAKRTLFLKNFGTAEVTLKCGAKSIAVPAGQARTVRLTGATDGLEDIGGGGSGGGSSLPTGGTTGQFLAKKTDANGDAEWIDPPEGGGSFIEAPSDGKTYGRKNEAWAEIPASAGGSAGEAPTFKIWRLYVARKAGISQVGIDTWNINNIATATTQVAGSSEESGSYIAGMVRPGVAGTWYSAPNTDNNPWVEYTFPEAIAGDSIYIWSNNPTYQPSSLRLEARNSEADSWTVVIPDTVYTPVVGNETTYGIPRVIEVEGDSGIPEAPTDGKQYARKDAAWSEVVTTGGGGGGTVGGGYIPVKPATLADLSTIITGTDTTVEAIADARNFVLRRTDTGVSSQERLCAALMPIPATGNWEALAVIKTPGRNRFNYTRHGMVIRNSANDRWISELYSPQGGDPRVQGSFHANKDNVQAGVGWTINCDDIDFFMLRWRIVDDLYAFDLSFNMGTSWTSLYAPPSGQSPLGGRPDQVGLANQSYNTFSLPNDMSSPFFEFKAL